MNNINFTAPTGDTKRIENVELIPTGMQICTLYSMIDFGHQETNFGLKPQIKLAFEFPDHMRIFYEGNEAKPASVFEKEMLSMNAKSNLRKKFIQPMINRIMTDDEAAVYNISQLLGKHYVATISHSPDGKWANIQSICPLDEKNMLMFGLTSPNIPIINKLQFFHLSQGFHSAEFGFLPRKIREGLMTSSEGQKHKLSGGTFAEPPKTDNSSSNAMAGAPPQGSAVPNGLIMIDQAVTYDAYIKAGWNDQQLIDHGKAKRNAPVETPTVVSGPPAGAPPVSAPPVAAPPVQAPIAEAPEPEKKLVFVDPNAAPLEQWIAGGWNIEKIISEKHASFQ